MPSLYGSDPSDLSAAERRRIDGNSIEALYREAIEVTDPGDSTAEAILMGHAVIQSSDQSRSMKI